VSVARHTQSKVPDNLLLCTCVSTLQDPEGFKMRFWGTPPSFLTHIFQFDGLSEIRDIAFARECCCSSVEVSCGLAR